MTMLAVAPPDPAALSDPLEDPQADSTRQQAMAAPVPYALMRLENIWYLRRLMSETAQRVSSGIAAASNDRCARSRNVRADHD